MDAARRRREPLVSASAAASRCRRAPDAAQLTLTVDGRYQLFVNGARVGRGPVRCDPHHQRTDTYDIAPQLRAGRERHRPAGARLRRRHLLVRAGRAATGSRYSATAASTATAACAAARRGRRAAPTSSGAASSAPRGSATRRAPQLGTSASSRCTTRGGCRRAGREPGFDDSGWDAVQILRVGGGPPDAPFGGMAVEPFPTLLPREIPFLAESPRRRRARPALVRRRAAARAADRRPPLSRRRCVDAAGRAGRAIRRRCCAPTTRATMVRTTADAMLALVLDFGRIHSGYPFIELDARGGEIVEVAVAEGMPGEWDGTPPAQPRVVEAPAAGAHVFRYMARPGAQRFERFEWAAVRYAQVTVRNAPHGLRIRHVGSTFTHYPAEPRGALRLLRSAADPAVGDRPLHAAAVHARRLGGLPRPRAAPVARRRDGRVRSSARSASARASTRSTASSCATPPRASVPTG